LDRCKNGIKTNVKKSQLKNANNLTKWQK